jgi:hypothetical protein
LAATSKNAAEPILETAYRMQNSLPTAAASITRPASPPPEKIEQVDWADDACAASNNFFASELGRTGEEFVLPKQYQS